MLEQWRRVSCTYMRFGKEYSMLTRFWFRCAAPRAQARRPSLRVERQGYLEKFMTNSVSEIARSGKFSKAFWRTIAASATEKQESRMKLFQGMFSYKIEEFVQDL